MSNYRVSKYDAPEVEKKSDAKPGELSPSRIPIFDSKGRRRGHFGRLASEATVARFGVADPKLQKKDGRDAWVGGRRRRRCTQFRQGRSTYLEDLQVSSDGYEDFSSYDAFYKGEPSLEVLAKRFGPAGDGQQYHHIVTQGGADADNISPDELQNTNNIIRLPTLLHEAVNAEYLKPRLDTNMTKYQWLQTQPYDVQREEGLRILRDLHILK
jgi:hypothetical protein